MQAAIVVKKIKLNQLSYLIKRESENNTIIVFSQEENRMNTNNGYSICSVYDLWNYKGENIIATDIDSCRIILKNPSVKKFFFYVWDLEWLRLNDFDYESLYNIYGNEDIVLVARSHRHASAIQNCWNRKSLVVENFNIKEILGEINDPVIRIPY